MTQVDELLLSKFIMNYDFALNPCFYPITLAHLKHPFITLPSPLLAQTFTLTTLLQPLIQYVDLLC
jgi:hypothetical protein